MKQTKSRISKFTGERKIVEIPKEDRQNFEIGEKVIVKKIKKVI